MPQKQNKSKVRKVVLTGGHAATTALSMVEEFVRRSNKKMTWDIYWVGAAKAFEGKNVPTLESKALPKLGVTYYPIIAGKLQRRLTIWSIASFVKIPIGFFHAAFILAKVKPDVILAFGGFAALPVVVVGHLMKIPTVIHEQTAAVGLANKLSSFLADKIALARPQSMKFFPKAKTVVVGNPIMTRISEILPKEKLSNPAVIYITGGSRGAKAINDLVEDILPELLSEFKVVHHTGHLDFERFKKLSLSFSEALRKNYEVYASIDPMRIDRVYERADIVLSRAGANTVAEVISVKRPALLIPLSIAYKNEQRKNAMIAYKFGIAKVLDQEKLTPEGLLEEIDDTYANWNATVDKVKDKPSPDKYASRRLVDLLEKII